MTALVRAEWLKFRTTAVPWVLTGIALLVTGLWILRIFTLPNDYYVGFRNSSSTTGFLIPHTVDELRNVVGAGEAFGFLFALLLGLLCITTEFRHKTVTTSFLVTPRRSSFVISKLLSAALFGVGLAVIVLVGAVGGGGLALVGRGGSFSALLRQVPAVAPGVILVFALFAILGVGVGSLLTNQVAALIVSLGWFLVVEPIFTGLVPSAERWTPTGAASAAANFTQLRTNGPGIFNWWQGALLLLLYGLAFALVGSIVMSRRDIT